MAILGGAETTPPTTPRGAAPSSRDAEITTRRSARRRTRGRAPSSNLARNLYVDLMGQRGGIPLLPKVLAIFATVVGLAALCAGLYLERRHSAWVAAYPFTMNLLAGVVTSILAFLAGFLVAGVNARRQRAHAAASHAHQTALLMFNSETVARLILEFPFDLPDNWPGTPGAVDPTSLRDAAWRLASSPIPTGVPAVKILRTVLAFHTDQVRWYVAAYCNSDETPVERSIANEMDQLAAGLQPALDSNNTGQAAHLESQYCRCLATLMEMVRTEQAVKAYHEMGGQRLTA